LAGDASAEGGQAELQRLRHLPVFNFLTILLHHHFGLV